jgi:hypothetical protein
MSRIAYGKIANGQSSSNGRPLTYEQIASVAPALFSNSPAPSVSPRYAAVNSGNVLRQLHDQGFHVFQAGSARVRRPGGEAFARHMLRLRHESSLDQIGGAVPEIIFVNSHDGSSSYRMMAGLFRMVCFNGLIAGDMSCDLRFRHSGDQEKLTENVIEGAFTVIERSNQMARGLERFSSVQLNTSDLDAFSNRAAVIRWPDEKDPSIRMVRARRLLDIRRWEDESPDLWTVYNRVQENAINGIPAIQLPTHRIRATRRLTAIPEVIRINQGLWNLMEEFAD